MPVPPDSGQIALAPKLGSALHVKLGIAQLQRIAHRCAVVVFLQQIGMARLGLAQLGLQNGTRIGIAGALVVVVDPRGSGWRGGGPTRRRSARCLGAGADTLYHGDVSALDQLAAALLGLCGVVGVFVAAAINAVLRPSSAAKSLPRAPANAVCSSAGSVKKEEKSAPSSVRRDKPSVFSSAALANCTAPSERSTATSVDIRSSE